MDPAAYRFSGMWGAAYDEKGNLLMDLIEVNAPLEIGRITVPLVGTQDEGYKQGRNTREGTISVQKVDTNWENFVWTYASKTVEQRRLARDKGQPFDPSFMLSIVYNDPEALGVERWHLTGVRLWRLTLGFSLADELVTREYPITWSSEVPVTAFKATSSGGKPQANYVVGKRPDASGSLTGIASMIRTSPPK